MNQFFFETRGKEKVKELMNEGMTGQALSRSSFRRPSFLSRIPKLILVLLAVLGVLQIIVK